MNISFGLLMAMVCLLFNTARATSYSTEATMSLQKDDGTYQVLVRVSRLIARDGKIVEELISAPRIESAPGVPANLYSGLTSSHTNYPHEENVSVEVSWPYPNESGTARCHVLVKLGDKLVSQSKFQLQVVGPGRSPLVVQVDEVEADSVKVVDVKSKPYILLEFRGKTKEAVKELARDHYGNQFHVRDQEGRVVEGGVSFGSYQERGMAVEYPSAEIAQRVADLLRRKP